MKHAQDAETQGAVTVPAAEKEETVPVFLDHLPERDWEEADYTILAAAEQWAGKFWVEEETGEVLNDAVFARNLAVEERFGVRFVYDSVNGYTAGQTDVNAKLYDAVMAGGAEYDHYVGDSYYIAAKLIEGYFADLSASEYMDFTEPYWFQYINPNLIVGGVRLCACGAYDLQTGGENWVILFGKDLAAQLGMPSFYDDVRGNRWTMDLFLSYARQAPSDLDGNGSWDERDRYGLLSTQNEAFIGLNYGMGRTITVVNEEGLPCLTGADERVVNIMDTLTRLMQCPKMLWLDKHKPSAKVIPPQILERLDAGNDFGDRAMGMFGPFVEMTTYLPGTTDPDKKDNP